jgi:hypothetical protein
MATVLNLFPSRIAFVNPDGTLTPSAYRALQILAIRVGGPLGDNGVDVFSDTSGYGSQDASSTDMVTQPSLQPTLDPVLVDSTNASPLPIDWVVPDVMQAGSVFAVVVPVTSVTGTAPVSSSGGATPAISMAAATSSVPGYLTAADWTTFNNKQPAGSYQPAGTYVNTVDGNSGAVTAAQVSAAATAGYGFTPYSNANPAGYTSNTGTVTAVSVVSANGLAGTSSGGATPALTLSTSVTGLLKGNGLAISAAVANADYALLAAPVTKTADWTVASSDVWFINNKAGSTATVTIPAASLWTGRWLTFKNMQAQFVVSASSNVTPLDSTTAGTSILLPVIGNWATLVSDGTNWVTMQSAPNNILLTE